MESLVVGAQLPSGLYLIDALPSGDSPLFYLCWSWRGCARTTLRWRVRALGVLAHGSSGSLLTDPLGSARRGWSLVWRLPLAGSFWGWRCAWRLLLATPFSQAVSSTRRVCGLVSSRRSESSGVRGWCPLGFNESRLSSGVRALMTFYYFLFLRFS